MNHRILLRKVDRYGIRGVGNELIADFLYSRCEYVKICDELSTALQIAIGVPQVSLLCPLPFIIYVYDFFQSSS